MPPSKSSANKVGAKWNQCIDCGIILLKSLNDTHKCSQEELPLSQSFIFKHEFATSCIVEHSKDVDKDIDIPKDYLVDFVFINPTTMKLCNFKIGDYLVLFSQDIPVCMVKCWPLNSIELDKIALSKPYLTNNQVIIRKYDSIETLLNLNLTLVQQIPFKINLFNEDYAYLSEFFKDIYQNKVILKDQLLNLTYFGQNLQFKVLNLAKNHQKSIKIDDLVDNFEANLNLNSQNGLKYDSKFKDANLEPIKSKLKANLTQINCFLIDKNTNLTISNVNLDDTKDNGLRKTFSFDDIGGLKDEIELLKELYIYPFDNIELYKEIGVQIAKGVLLHGLSGCGKTLLAKTLCSQAKCNVIEMNCGEIFSRNYGESDTKLRELFENAWSRSPCIIFIDELDTICSERKTLHDTEKRLVSLFSNLMDESNEKGILFLATTNKLDQIDAALRRPGRFDKEIEIQIPNIKSREEILKIHLKSLKNSLTHDDLSLISQNCHGYVGADLKMLITEAANSCISRLINEKHDQKSITKEDLFKALHKVKPSAMRAISFDIPQVKWSDIGGQDELKKKLQQAIVWPIKFSKSFERIGIKAPRGILMYGPPGCSKTMVAKALATETGLNFIAVKGPELFSKWVGESERAVREIFQKARNAAPAIIFFDEIDALASERSTGESKSGGTSVGDRVLATLLNEIDGVENLNDVTIVAATNRPDMIDKALMRPGRLDRLVYVKLPDEQTRKEIFKIKFNSIPISSDVDLDELVKLTEKYSGAELTALCNEAAYLALDTDINTENVKRSNFLEALEIVRPRISEETIRYFDNFSLK